MDGSLSCHNECTEGPGLKSQPLRVAAGGGVSLKGLAHPVCNVCTIIHVGGRGLWLRKLAAQTSALTCSTVEDVCSSLVFTG